TTIAAQASVAIQNARLYAQTDEALARRVQELNSILSTAAEGILLLNTDLTVVEVNRALSNMLNTTPANIRGQNLANAKNSLLKQLQLETKVLDALIAGEIDTHQSEVTLSGTADIPVERTITPVLGEANLITGWLVVYRDLTEELELERVKEDLTRMLVHDLRSPIVSIQGGLDMIEVMINDDDKEALLEMLNISRKGSHLILGMINQILNLNKMESGNMNLNIEPLALPTLFNEERMQFKNILQQHNINIKVDFSNELPVIHADRDLMTRVMHNLIDNAIKYSEDGGEITAWGKPDPENPEKVLFGIADRGFGIPKDIQPYLFDKYFTGQHVKARRKGTGLGLYFCKLAVEAHGGEIGVESETGKGSNFIIRMPERQ
ncbi:MAG TPA: HAMP domain-containing sensor histidine kinase, partial [Anaerolineales bacterium]|nr:HAMP domain-containing sensor histidine kinase [Anaerolineales bacterium]